MRGWFAPHVTSKCGGADDSDFGYWFFSDSNFTKCAKQSYLMANFFLCPTHDGWFAKYEFLIFEFWKQTLNLPFTWFAASIAANKHFRSKHLLVWTILQPVKTHDCGADNDLDYDEDDDFDVKHKDDYGIEDDDGQSGSQVLRLTRLPVAWTKTKLQHASRSEKLWWWWWWWCYIAHHDWQTEWYRI